MSLSKFHFRKCGLFSAKSEGEGEIENFRLRAQRIYNAPLTFSFLLPTIYIHILSIHSTTRTMASIYDKLAQAKYEEKLKATIISESQLVYCATSRGHI